MTELLNGYLLSCYDFYTPLKAITPARRKWRRHRTASNFDTYKRTKNDTQATVRTAKSTYYCIFRNLKELVSSDLETEISGTS